MVSNRVGPIAGDGAGQGGLVVALRAALEEAGGLWFGFSGTVNERPNPSPQVTTAGAVTAATLDLTRRDFDDYYVSYANQVLWPLLHYRPSLIGYSRRAAAGYRRVNDAFARALLPLLPPGDPCDIDADGEDRRAHTAAEAAQHALAKVPAVGAA